MNRRGFLAALAVLPFVPDKLKLLEPQVLMPTKHFKTNIITGTVSGRFTDLLRPGLEDAWYAQYKSFGKEW